MCRVAIGLVGLLACSQPPPAKPSTVANHAPVTATPMPKPCGELGWFERTRYLRYSTFSHGHFGEWRFYVDLYRLDGVAVFQGVAVGTYRQHERAPMHTETRAVTLATADAVKLLDALRDGITTRGEDATGVVVSDSSRSVVIAVEAMAFDPRVGRHPNFHVQFFTDHGEIEPQPWNIRGCSFAPPLAARRAIQRTTDAFATMLGSDAMLQALMQRRP